jgi:hypothetical protein
MTWFVDNMNKFWARSFDRCDLKVCGENCDRTIVTAFRAFYRRWVRYDGNATNGSQKHRTIDKVLKRQMELYDSALRFDLGEEWFQTHVVEEGMNSFLPLSPEDGEPEERVGIPTDYAARLQSSLSAICSVLLVALLGSSYGHIWEDVARQSGDE